MVTCFQRGGKICCEKLRLNIHLRTGIRVPGQSLMMKAWIPSFPTYFDGLRRFIVLWTSESQTGAIGRESDDQISVEMSCMQCLMKTLFKYAANFCNFTLPFQTFSINSLEVIIDNAKPFEFIAHFGSFDKPIFLTFLTWDVKMLLACVQWLDPQTRVCINVIKYIIVAYVS